MNVTSQPHCVVTMQQLSLLYYLSGIANEQYLRGMYLFEPCMCTGSPNSNMSSVVSSGFMMHCSTPQLSDWVSDQAVHGPVMLLTQTDVIITLSTLTVKLSN